MHEHSIDICVIEDDAAQRRLLVRQLDSFGFTIVEAEDGERGLRQIYEHRPRVVICDLMLPELSGLHICRHVRADPTLDGTYVILMTAHDCEGRKTAALKAGADDYIKKPYDPHELLARIRSGLRFHRLQERLRHAAHTDGLTELWNHTYFHEALEREFVRTRRYGGVVSLLMVDLDHFKAVNDAHGHEIGNQVLKLTARHLRGVVRESDIVARYGGEEFAIICPSTAIEEAAQLAERLREQLPLAVAVPDRPELRLHTSVGVISSEDPRVSSPSDLVNLADQALYHSKRTGRNRVTRADEIGQLPSTGDVCVAEVDRLRKEVVALSMRAKDLCLQSVWALIQALEARDEYSAWHSRNVTLYTRWLAEAAGWPKPLRVAAANAAMLHDLGKIGIPDGILLNPGRLEPAEAAVLRQVPLITCKILEPLRVFETETLIIRHLREHFDGTGYPDGLSGSSIPIGSRILAITEAFDSITCDRAYRPGRSIDEALKIIQADAGKHFDPEFTDVLVANVARQRGRWEAQVGRARTELPEVLAEAAAEG